MAIDFNKLDERDKKRMLASAIHDFSYEYETPIEILEEILEYLQKNYKNSTERRAEKNAKAAKKKRK